MKASGRSFFETYCASKMMILEGAKMASYERGGTGGAAASGFVFTAESISVALGYKTTNKNVCRAIKTLLRCEKIQRVKDGRKGLYSIRPEYFDYLYSDAHEYTSPKESNTQAGAS